MAKESFVLVSLKEDKAKKLAQVITNDSCKKILEYLTENEATESELALKLNLPISTVHYNLQHLIDSELITADEFHYSEKGKEVNHYKLANKYIIIAPKSTWGIKEKLRSILPAALIAIAAAGFIQVFSRYFAKTASFGMETAARSNVLQQAAAGEIAKTAADQAVAESVQTAIPMVAEKAAAVAPNVTQKMAESVPQIVSEPNIALWFLYGALFVSVVYLIINIIRKK